MKIDCRRNMRAPPPEFATRQKKSPPICDSYRAEGKRAAARDGSVACNTAQLRNSGEVHLKPCKLDIVAGQKRNKKENDSS
jgi:hypothetical protein